MSKAFTATVAYSSAYLVLGLACLIQWGSSDPWSRLNLFALSYFALRTVGSIHSLVSSREVFRSKPVRREWWALNSDPNGIKWVVGLMLADLLVLLDYGHWHIASFLARPLLQSIGIAIYVAVVACQMWTDTYLASYFRRAQRELRPMDEGPYSFVRHPRYAAAIAGKVAFALIFASILGWAMVLAWGVLNLRKVEIEEAHLRRLFGESYEAYEQRTAKLLPGVY
ncbi:MAG: isoprenylcysteine carboxylmethyltransferase family protein [Terriglobia bacterium]